MEVTPVVLVKNEEFWLPYCLSSVAGHFDKMVIYDVGSEDDTLNVIDWFVEKEKHRTKFIIKKLPDCPPEVQGVFRNSMIAEAESEFYWILDGDEIYNKEDVIQGLECVNTLKMEYNIESRKKYGLFRRIEVSPDLREKYGVEREHHRLYHRTAIWKGTHPGEVAVYAQNKKSEVDFKANVRVLHMHNVLRSRLESKTHSRIKRKNQLSYHPGKLVGWDVLREYPILSKRINNFKVAPALERLWHDFL